MSIQITTDTLRKTLSKWRKVAMITNHKYKRFDGYIPNRQGNISHLNLYKT
ncbi:hypothetical protein AGMMS49921_09170 [Endomicrobiia bacterium]|nr:hypothetical protein AGMMS49921_09170 [Endomicrobiia bacterium]